MLTIVEARNLRNSQGRNILVIDDDVFLGHSVCGVLEQNGFNCLSVLTLAGLHEAITKGYEPDLIITDLHINAESGCDVLRYFRKHRRYRDVPVLLISSDEGGSEVAAENNFDGFLAKTFIFSKLMDHVHQLVNWNRRYME
jgi:CheY-like chemotaxis protein